MLWGDFGEAPLDALAQVSTAVMLPLFSNPTVRAAWPDTVAQDLTTQLHKFLSVGAPSAQAELAVTAAATHCSAL